MINDRYIVYVSANFVPAEQLRSILNKYARHSDQHFAYWDEFAFTTLLSHDCDAVLVFNSPGEVISLQCDPTKVIAFMMEPGIPSEHPWMFRNLDQYHRVYSPVIQSINSVASHGFLGWYPDLAYQQLAKNMNPEKTRLISCIASGLNRLPGHRNRLRFIGSLQERLPQVDLFGRGTNFLPRKQEGLIPYRYSIAIENSAVPHYFTEKINDCFLFHTVPVYYGCANIGQYFPERSFIQINIDEPHTAIRKIEEILMNDDWESRAGAVSEARELVLERYQPLAGAASILRENGMHGSRKKIELKPTRRNLLNRLSSRVHYFFQPDRNSPEVPSATFT